MRMDVFFVGLLAFAALLMLRQPLFFPFMIAGFFYATVLRPLPWRWSASRTTSVLINTLIAGVAADGRSMDVVARDRRRPDAGDQRRGRSSGRRSTEQSEERREALAQP